MKFSPFTPIYNVESLFKTYSTSINRDSVSVDSEGQVDESILAVVIQVLNHTNILKSEDLAEKLGVSDRKLSGAVELLTGLPLSKFIREWRFMQSQQLLLNTDLSYVEIAARCGYVDESSLILIYEKRLKTTPHIFRTGYRIGNTNYSFNRHGYSNRLYGEDRAAKNKVFAKK